MRPLFIGRAPSVIFIVVGWSSCYNNNLPIVLIEVCMGTIVIRGGAVKTCVGVGDSQTMGPLRTLEITRRVLYHSLATRKLLDFVIDEDWRMQLGLVGWLLLTWNLLMRDSCRRSVITLELSGATRTNKRTWNLRQILIELSIKLSFLGLLIS